MANATGRSKGLFGPCSSTGLGVHYHPGGKHGAAAESTYLDPEGAKNTLGMVESLETSKPTPSDTPPPARPHLQIVPKHFHQLGT